MARSIVVSVGTDFHKFDRLIDWVDNWMIAHGEDVELFVQHGFTRSSPLGENVEMLPHAEILSRFESATAVVLQGGPGGILDARSVGVVPIVVPRRPHLDEVKDEHQVAFTRFMAGTDDVVLAEEESALHRALSAAMTDPQSMRCAPRVPPLDETAEALERVVLGVMSRPAGFVRWSRLGSKRTSARRTARVS